MLCINFSPQSSTMYGQNPKTIIKKLYSILNSRSYDSYVFIISLICSSKNFVYADCRQELQTLPQSVNKNFGCEKTMLLLCIFLSQNKFPDCHESLWIFHLKSGSNYTLCSGKFHVLKWNLWSMIATPQSLSRIAIVPTACSIRNFY